MENKECAIRVSSVTKKYNLYSKPQDRFREAVGLKSKKRKLHEDFYALNNVSFDVMKGETVGIVGTNGSGKSTLLKMITGVLEPTQGTIEVHGRISALLELGAGFNQEYTGLENIYLNGRMMGISRKEMEKRVPAIVEFADIGVFIDQPVKTYSSGMFARLAFAVAINVEPDILIVDEALSVGDLFFQNKCFKKFDELKEKGVTILFVSHDISSVRQMCNRVLWIEKGQQMMFDQSDKVCDAYMDKKRSDKNDIVSLDKDDKSTGIKSVVDENIFKAPRVCKEADGLKSEKLNILSAFFTDKNGNITNVLEVDEDYVFCSVLQFNSDIDNVILGFVLENNKGLPLFDINNFINQKQNLEGKSGDILKVQYSFSLPRIMKGTYVMGVATAEGTQDNNKVIEWLHNVDKIEIVNKGYNSSYIEVPAQIEVGKIQKENVVFY